MIYVATIEGGRVAQVTVQPDGYEPEEDEALIGRKNTVGIGWTWNGEFAPPDGEPE